MVATVPSQELGYPAEAYHQNYLERHPDEPYIVSNDAPKLEHLRQAFPAWYQNR